MKKLLMIGCLVMAACAGTGKGKIDEKAQQGLDYEAISTQTEISNIQLKTTAAVNQLQRQFDAYKEKVLVKAGYNTDNYFLNNCNGRWVVFDKKTNREVK